MASNCGPIGFTAGVTGSKTTNIGMTANWLRLEFRGTGLQPSTGVVYGGDQYALSDSTSSPVNKHIQVKNTSGTVVLEGTWTSFTGNNVVWNITTNTLPSNLSVLATFGN